MKGIILIGCRGNINRVYRLCYIFGIPNLYLKNCKEAKIGNVFSAKGNVNVRFIDNLHGFENVVALEKNRGARISEEIGKYDYIAVGGENVTLRKKCFDNFIHIPIVNSLCLTTDQALAAALAYTI